MRKIVPLIIFLGLLQTSQADEQVLENASMSQFQESVAPLLKQFCYQCHNDQKASGELNLVKLAANMKTSGTAARWAMVDQKLNNGSMPPKSQAQLSAHQKELILGWLKQEMKRAGISIAKREQQVNGNLVPHELLFDPQQAAPFEVAPRVRRLSPEIYARFLAEVGKNVPGVTQPFTATSNQNFRDMGAPLVDEPVTAMLIRNALAIVNRQTAYRLEAGVPKGVGFVAKEVLACFDPRTPVSDATYETAIRWEFQMVLKRPPTVDELQRFLALMKKNVKDAGTDLGVRYTLAAVFLLPEAIFRYEVGATADLNAEKVRLSAMEIAHAINYGLTDSRPPAWLLADAASGKLATREGVQSAIQKLWDDPKVEKSRIMRFFHEYFGYQAADEVFKDPKQNNQHDARILVADTDRLIELILKEDKNVLLELLTTNRSFVGASVAEDTRKKRLEAIQKFEEEKKKNPAKFVGKEVKLPGKSIYESYNLTDFPTSQPVELPKDQRAGILTQPSWLVAMSTSDDNHAIHRGKWIRERLLGGVVPDIPITVDAQLPHAPEKTLRQRMMVTQQEYCWKCHQLMNPLGLTFEMYDHYGRYRTTEPVVDLQATAANKDKKGKPLGEIFRSVPVAAHGRIDLISGDQPTIKTVSGDVDHGIALIHRLAKSEYVEQVFIRHAFRYWLARNENLGDGPSLQAAHRAYRASQGSMKALVIELLSSEAFLYRTSVTTKTPTKQLSTNKDK